MNELIILVWTFVVASVIEFLGIMILGVIINHYREEAQENWNLYIKECKAMETLKEKMWSYYDV